MSILVPVFRPDRRFLEEMLQSILIQNFMDWELICVDDCSESEEVSLVLADMARDPRVKIITRCTNGGIVAASNDALAAARGEFVALVDHDDLLVDGALGAVMHALAQHGDADVLYTDEGHVDSEGLLSNSFHKPDFSPERLRGQMYIGHLGVYRRSLLMRIGGFREGFDGSQDYDLALRATELARRVVHIPQVWYRWRIHSASVSQRSDNAPVFAAARRALEEHLERVGLQGVVEQIHSVGVYRIRYAVIGSPLVSIIIPTRGSSAEVGGQIRCLVVDAVRSVVEKSTYQNFEIVVVADDSMSAQVRADLAQAGGDKLRFVPWSAPFNFAAKINRGVVESQGDFILMLNDDTEVITPDWLEVMLALAQQPDVGMVGPMLYFEDGTIQHGGHVYSGGGPGHVALGHRAGSTGPFAGLLVDREVSGVTGACALMPRAAYFAVGGMNLNLPINFNDVDLCLKVTNAGYRIIWTPHAELFHYESKTRVPRVVHYELDTLTQRWGRNIATDPFWPHGPDEGQ
ncbi:glycosyltransferase [Nakamurella antarctica]|uniref:Glycosyltransferase n=1 Tax=Nakamurella antarctica TaxID=1902245 RepID=A0A3G8ZME8_9ACTN|nr:glycosyltransferase [Nakamurella antarctica]AZI58522.1 glycosyltransferase [Nakamurella antarctica]